jgi:hypothetical protein
VIGFAPVCPAVMPPGASACGGTIASLDDVVGCVDCVLDFQGDCLTAAAALGVGGYPDACAPAATPTPTPSPTVTQTPSPTPTPAAGTEAIACERAIVKEAGKVVEARARALAACATLVSKGKLPPDTNCAAEPKTAAKIAKAAARLDARIPKACGGGNGTCDPFDQGPDADPTLAEIGWGLSACPSAVGGPCDGPLVDCNDVASCTGCIGQALVAQVVGVISDLPPAAPGSEAAKCQAAIVKSPGARAPQMRRRAAPRERPRSLSRPRRRQGVGCARKGRGASRHGGLQGLWRGRPLLRRR